MLCFGNNHLAPTGCSVGSIVKVATITFFAVLFCPFFGVTNGQNDNATRLWQGYVTDTHCGTNCQVTKDMTPDKKCIVRCVRKGSKYGLWAGNRVYVLQPQATAARYAAKNVRVKGELQGETIRISAIEEIDKAASQHSADP
jgi:hypothetical protein